VPVADAISGSAAPFRPAANLAVDPRPSPDSDRGDRYLRTRTGALFDTHVAPIRRLDGSACVLAPHEARALAELPREPYSLPEKIALGVSTIHRYREGHIDVTINAFVPMATAEFPGVILDLNAKRMFEVIPDRCILSDFGPRPCIGIDKRPGTPLDRWLRRFVACVPRGANGYELDRVLEYLRTRLNDVLRPRPEPADDRDRDAFPWDQDLQLPAEADAIFRAGAARGIDDPPLPAGVEAPVIPFERYLEAERGACLQNALLATLILERLGFACRLVNGAVDHGYALSGGHAWVELADGRVLCPTWELLQQPIRPPEFPGEFEVGVSLLFESQRSPYLRDAG
jgi:hypothetical protein